MGSLVETTLLSESQTWGLFQVYMAYVKCKWLKETNDLFKMFLISNVS